MIKPDSIHTPFCIAGKYGDVKESNSAFSDLMDGLEGAFTGNDLSGILPLPLSAGHQIIDFKSAGISARNATYSIHTLQVNDGDFAVSFVPSSGLQIKSASPSGQIELDHKFNLIDASPKTLSLIGLNSEDVSRDELANVLFPGNELSTLSEENPETDYCLYFSERALHVFATYHSNYIKINLKDISGFVEVYRNLQECNKRYKSIFVHSQVGMYQTMPDGTILSVNPAFASIFGYDSPEQMQDEIENVSNLYHKSADREKLQAFLLADGYVRNYECELVRRDGSHINVSLNTVCIQNDKNQVSHYEGTLIDLTERNTYKQMMKVFRDTIREVYDSIIICDLNNTIIFVNDAFSRMYGYEANEVIGKKSDEFWADHNPENRYEELDRVTLSEGGYHGEMLNRKKDGTVFPVLLSTSLIHDDNGEAYATMGIARDISGEKKVEEELKEARDKAEQASKLKSNLMANMSHEVRTPLTGIIGFASILLEQLEGSDDLLFYVENVKSSGERLLETMNNILMVSEIESDKVILKLGDTSLWETVEKSVRFNQPMATKTGLSLKLEGDKDLRVYTDQLLLTQILNIIINNALKFTEEGGVTVRVYTDGKEGVVEIQDTGVGISGDFLDQMYEAFAQESAGIRRKFQGVGLGLNICKKYIELINGTITVNSEKNVGSTFHIRIPTEKF